MNGKNTSRTKEPEEVYCYTLLNVALLKTSFKKVLTLFFFFYFSHQIELYYYT